MEQKNVLYQPYLLGGPFRYIESGYIKGFEKNSCRIKVWDEYTPEILRSILEEFKPGLFVGYLRTTSDYKNYPWIKNDCFAVLNEYRKKTGMKVALHTHPDVHKLTRFLELEFSADNDLSNAQSFYGQESPPNNDEKKLVEENFIDLILHYFSKEVTTTCFDYWINAGIPVLEEPLAADDSVYTKKMSLVKNIDISYIGGWWPFKGQQLDKFFMPMKKEFGGKFKIYGRDWPHLAEQEGHVTDKRFNQITHRSKIAIQIHEPSQVQEKRIHVNERIFKLLAMNAFAVCDNNPCLYEYFDEDELVVCSTPEEMVDKCKFYLKNSGLRKEVSLKGYKAVMERHTYTVRAKTLLSFLGI